MPNEFLRNKLLIICGPTATRKTALAVKLAKKFNGEVISADSRQVYRMMDIGTGKDLPQSAKLPARIATQSVAGGKIKSGEILKSYRLEGIPIWLYDVAEPDQLFSAADYYRLAWMVIEDIWQRRKLPILVGGTGFYIKAVVEGIGSLGIPPDWELRKILVNKDIKILGEELKKLDLKRWEQMNDSDRENPRRLIRAIEIATQKQLSTIKYQKGKSKIKNLRTLFIGLTASLTILYQRIDKRVSQRLATGAEKEIKGLLQKGFSWENSALGVTIGYKEWQPYFEKQASLEQIIERWKYDEHAYARRQMTWFKKALRQAQGYWFDITEQGWENKVEKLVSDWYTS